MVRWYCGTVMTVPYKGLPLFADAFSNPPLLCKHLQFCTNRELFNPSHETLFLPIDFVSEVC